MKWYSNITKNNLCNYLVVCSTSQPSVSNVEVTVVYFNMSIVKSIIIIVLLCLHMAVQIPVKNLLSKLDQSTGKCACEWHDINLPTVDFVIVIVTLASITMCFNLYCITTNNCALPFYSTVIINIQKQHVSRSWLITFFVRKIKTPNLEQVFYTYSFFTF